MILSIYAVNTVTSTGDVVFDNAIIGKKYLLMDSYATGGVIAYIIKPTSSVVSVYAWSEEGIGLRCLGEIG